MNNMDKIKDELDNIAIAAKGMARELGLIAQALRNLQTTINAE